MAKTHKFEKPNAIFRKIRLTTKENYEKNHLYLIAFAAFITNAHASETYNFQIGAQQYKSSSESNTNVAAKTLSGTYYFKPVVIDGSQPYLELDTIQRASSLTVTQRNMSYEDTDFKETTYRVPSISGTFYVNDFVFGFNNSKWSEKFPLKADPSFNYETNSKSIGFDFGYWVTTNTVVRYFHDKNDATYKRSSPLLDASADYKSVSQRITSHTVMQMGGTRSMVLDFGLAQMKSEQWVDNRSKEYNVNVRYYPDSNYFFEGGFSLINGDDQYDEGKTLNIGAGYAFTPRFGILLSTIKFKGDNSNSGYRDTLLTAGYRF